MWVRHLHRSPVRVDFSFIDVVPCDLVKRLNIFIHWNLSFKHIVLLEHSVIDIDVSLVLEAHPISQFLVLERHDVRVFVLRWFGEVDGRDGCILVR